MDGNLGSEKQFLFVENSHICMILQTRVLGSATVSSPMVHI